MKKIIPAIILSIVSVIAVTGCSKPASNSSASAAGPLSPKETISSYFAAVKSYDLNTIQELTVQDAVSSSPSAGIMDSSEYSEIFDSSDFDSSEYDGVAKAYLEKVDAEIEEEPVVSGDTATVKVKITAPDAETLYNDIITTVMSDMMSDIYSSQTSSEDYMSGVLTELQTELADSSLTNKVSEVTVNMTKVNNEWKVEQSDELVNALSGGLLDYVKNLTSSLSELYSSESEY